MGAFKTVSSGQGDAATLMHQVSVVMAVYQNVAAAEKTIRSVLQQCSATLQLELIIVDDGSDDNVHHRLQELATGYSAIVLLRQRNQGLTRALKRGCERARYPYIARIDVGDEMLSQRLLQQCDYLLAHPQVVLLGCWVGMQTAAGEHLFAAAITTTELRQSLALTDGCLTGSPAHCSVMFRTAAYHHVGGYRPAFYFAQDIDLWLRLAEHGEVAMLEQELGRSEFSATAISGAFHTEQLQLRDLAVAAARRRRESLDESGLLQQAAAIGGNPDALRRRQPATLYFIGRCLGSTNPRGARAYLWQALLLRPWSVKYWLAWLRALIVSGFR